MFEHTPRLLGLGLLLAAGPALATPINVFGANGMPTLLQMLDRMMVSGAAPAAQSGPYATDEPQQNTNSASGGAGQLVTLPTAGSVAPKGDGFGLAREDLLSCRWDWDSDDSVMMIESVTGVPEPAGLFLLGAGLLGLGVARRRVTRA